MGKSEMKTPFKLNFTQIAWVVNDLEKAKTAIFEGLDLVFGSK